MTDEGDRSPEERFHDEMVERYLDGLKPDNSEPSANRSASYRHGFANGRDDLAHSPRLPAQVLRLLADQGGRRPRHLTAAEAMSRAVSARHG